MVVSIYNLILDDSGKIVGRERVAHGTAKHLGATLDSGINHENLFTEKFLDSKLRLYSSWRDISGGIPKTGNLPVAILSMAVRVKHTFGITEKLRPKSSHGEMKSLIKGTLIRPLGRTMRLALP